MADTTSTVTIRPAANLVAPIKAGTIVGTVTADPALSKYLALKGADTAKINLVGAPPNYTLIAAVDLIEGTYNVETLLLEPFKIVVAPAGTVDPPPPPTGTYPGQSGMQVGHKAAPGYPGSLTKWGGGALTAGATYNFIWFDGVPTTPNGVKFFGCRFTSNWTDGWNMGNAANVECRFCTWEPSVVAAPPQPAWPSGGAGKNVDGTTGGGFEPYMIAHNQGYQYGILQASGSLLIEDSDIWGFGNAITLYGTEQKTIRRCWIHDAAAEGSGSGQYHQDGPGHLDGSGCSNVLIEDCTIASLGNTNGLAFQAGTYHGITVQRCYLSGFGFCVDIGHGTAANTNLTFVDNIIATDIGWHWGPLYTDFSANFRKVGSSWARNRFRVMAGTRPASSSNPKYTSVDDGKFIWPNSTLSATDWVP